MIRIDHLTKNYGDFHLDVSLNLPAGRITGLVGRNGAGKSTTIKAILGLISPDGGSVQVLGKEASGLSGAEKEQLGVALADSGFSGSLTAGGVAKILKKLYHGFDEEYFRSMLQAQGLPETKLIKEYSTGMKAKLRVLTALSHKARLLILDEPTAGLDVLARNEILDLLRAYLSEDESRSLLITSHISTDLESLCDDICMIHDGRVIVHEDTDVILGNYGVLKVAEDMYEMLDKQYLLKTLPAPYGYTCLTNEKQYYLENYPWLVIENGSIDEMIVLLAGSDEGKGA